VSAVVKVRAPVVFGFEEVVGPAQNLFDGGDKVFLGSCKISEGVRNVFNVWSRGGSSAKEVGCGSLR
jgi:hypothetical protein